MKTAGRAAARAARRRLGAARKRGTVDAAAKVRRSMDGCTGTERYGKRPSGATVAAHRVDRHGARNAERLEETKDVRNIMKSVVCVYIAEHVDMCFFTKLRDMMMIGGVIGLIIKIGNGVHTGVGNNGIVEFWDKLDAAVARVAEEALAKKGTMRRTQHGYQCGEDDQLGCTCHTRVLKGSSMTSGRRGEGPRSTRAAR